MKPTHNCFKCGHDFNKEELKKALKAYSGKCPFCNSSAYFHYDYKEVKAHA